MRFRKMDRSLKDMDKSLVITVSPKGKVSARKVPEKGKGKPEQAKSKKPFLGGHLVPKPQKAEEIKPKKGKVKPVEKEDDDFQFKKRSRAVEYAMIVWGVSLALYFILLLWNLLTASPYTYISFDKFPII